jgi:hypothetical protein
VPRASECRTIGDRQIGFATTMRGPFLPRPERLGLVKKYQKMDRGKKTGDLRDDLINVIGCR